MMGKIVKLLFAPQVVIAALLFFFLYFTGSADILTNNPGLILFGVIALMAYFMFGRK